MKLMSYVWKAIGKWHSVSFSGEHYWKTEPSLRNPIQFLEEIALEKLADEIHSSLKANFFKTTPQEEPANLYLTPCVTIEEVIISMKSLPGWSWKFRA